MNLDEQFLKKIRNTRLIEQVNENVIRIPNHNTLNTKVKQIRNPQKEISEGFLIIDQILCSLQYTAATH